MSMDVMVPWLMLLALGALHGVNPAMGWLFAVGLGLQEGSRRAVWRALGPLALGHLLAIGATVAVMAALGLMIPLSIIKWIVAALLLGMGVLQLRRHWHPRYGGMRMGAKDLTTWSFLMATAHGAGLMAMPFVLGMIGASTGQVGDSLTGFSTDGGVATGAHAHHADLVLGGLGHEHTAALFGTALHTAGYLLVMGLLAVVVYEKLGLRLLRTAWINLDLFWAGALILTAVLTPLL